MMTNDAYVFGLFFDVVHYCNRNVADSFGRTYFADSGWAVPSPPSYEVVVCGSRISDGTVCARFDYIHTVSDAG